MGKLQKAIKLEKKGKFKSALKLYQNLDRKNLSDENYLYIKRSIAACLYYLKEYDKAIHEFESIIKNISLENDLKNQIQDNMHLCYLYGNSTQKGIDFFNDRIMNYKQNSEKKCWWFWYIGQGYQHLKKYEEAEKSYKNAYNISKELNSIKASFFLLYIAVIQILQNHINEAEKILIKYKNLYEKNENNGLFDILNGLVIMRIDPNKGLWVYKKGIKKAKKEKWQENIDLSEKLIKCL